MLDLLLGIAILLLVVAGVVWAGRTKPTGDGGSNVDAARRYGQGAGG